MKKLFKVILFYIFGVIVVQLIAETAKDTWFHAISNYLLLFTFFVLLVYVGVSLKNKEHKKKYFIYGGIVVGQVTFFYLPSLLPEVNSTNHNLVFALAFFVISTTVFILLFKTAKSVQETNEKLSLVLNLSALLGIIATAIISIIFLVIAL